LNRIVCKTRGTAGRERDALLDEMMNAKMDRLPKHQQQQDAYAFPPKKAG